MLRSLLLVALLPLMADAATVTVELAGVDLNRGDALCAIFSDPASFSLREPIEEVMTSDYSCGFSDVPNGVYAVAIFQDINGSGKLEKNFLSIPKEPWGMSNNVRNLFRAPNFQEAAFPVNGDTTIYIKLGYQWRALEDSNPGPTD